MNPAELFRHDEGALSLAAGDFLFREGESGDKMYVLLEGTADIMVGDSSWKLRARVRYWARWR